MRHLLTHTSGIADDADEEAGEDYEALWVDRPVYSVIETRDFLPLFAYKPAVFAPGENCRYCNVGYTLVGLAIEAVTGTSYREHVRTAVFERAGMAASGFFDRRDAVPDVAEGWDPVKDEAGARRGWKANIFSYPPIGSPADGAHVTAGDLVSFAQAVRAGREDQVDHRNVGGFSRIRGGKPWHIPMINLGRAGCLTRWRTTSRSPAGS